MFNLLVDTWFNAMETFIPLLGKCLHKDFYEGYDFDSYFKTVKLYTEFEGEKTYPKLINYSLSENIDIYEFSIPLGYSKQKLESFKEGMELSIGYKIDFKFNKFWIIEVIKKGLPEIISYIHTYRKNSLIIPLGESLQTTVSINLRENPNTYVCGTTGSGKSVCSKSILTTIINNFNHNRMKITLCDLKRVELNLFKNVAHVERFSTDLLEISEIIVDFLQECDNRYKLFEDKNVVDIYEYNNLSTEKIPYKLLFIEEIVLLLQDKKHTAMNNLKQLLSICRACGIFVVVTTQRPSCDVLDNVAKACINNRIVFKVEDSKNSIIALDSVGAEELKGKGHGILKVGANVEEFQGYFIKTSEVKKLIKPFEVEKEIKKDIIIDLDFIDKL